MSSKWKVSGINYANLDQPRWNLVVTVAGPLGAKSTFYPEPPENYTDMTFKQMEEFVLQKWIEANAC